LRRKEKRKKRRNVLLNFSILASSFIYASWITPEDVKEYLSRKFGEFLNNRSFLDALPGHLLRDSGETSGI